MIRVILPPHLRGLARVHGEVELEVAAPVTQRSVVDALEGKYPMLRGTIRDYVTQQRRPFLRFFACERDLSLESPDAPFPDAVASGLEPLVILGAIAGG
ncbi:MAG: MoaD/ThiS family protein [Silvibacterium sp.]|jgi:sulfur-carrier protein